MSEKKDPPIVGKDFKFGVNVVDFGEVRITRGLTDRPKPHICNHSRIAYDPKERRVWCEGCETDIDPYDALMLIIEQYDHALKKLDRREAEAKAATDHALISIASKVIDKIWRSKSSLPCCPNCGDPIFPEDVKSGLSSVSKELAYARRNKKP